LRYLHFTLRTADKLQRTSQHNTESSLGYNFWRRWVSACWASNFRSLSYSCPSSSRYYHTRWH